MQSFYFSIHQKESVLHVKRFWYYKCPNADDLDEWKNCKKWSNWYSQWIKPHWFIFIQKAVISTASTWQGLGRKVLELCTVTDTICIVLIRHAGLQNKDHVLLMDECRWKSLAILAGVKELSAPKYQYQQKREGGRACKAYIVCNVHNQSQ